jgi:hypothetical protein
MSSSAVDPLRVRTFPTDRRAEPKQHVAGEDHALLGQVHDHVTDRVRRPDVAQLDAESVEIEVEAIVEDRRRRCQFDAAEVPLARVPPRTTRSRDLRSPSPS